MRIPGIKSTNIWWVLAALAIMPVLALTLAAQQTNSLVVAGQQGSAKVIQVDGHNYVEVEGLARLTNSSIRFNGSQVVLSVAGGHPPASTAQGTPAPVAPAPATAPASGFSRDFVTAGIEAMSEVREWHAALKSAIEHGYPLGEAWLASYRAQTQQQLRLASLVVNTTSDKNAFPFLTNQFNNMSTLSDKYLQMTKSMTYISPDSLDNDTLDLKIRGCTRSLASMATTNQFVDDGSCQ